MLHFFMDRANSVANTKIGFDFTGLSIDNRSKGGNFGGMIMGNHNFLYSMFDSVQEEGYFSNRNHRKHGRLCLVQ